MPTIHFGVKYFNRLNLSRFLKNVKFINNKKEKRSIISVARVKLIKSIEKVFIIAKKQYKNAIQIL